MTVNGLSGSIAALYQTSRTSGTSGINSAGSASQIGNGAGMQEMDGNRPSPPPGGGFGKAIMQALSSLGINVDSNTSDSTESMSASFGDFMHSLTQALHAQSASETSGNGEEVREGESSDGAVRGHGHHHGGPDKMQADLQSLIQKLSTSTASSNSTGDGTSGNEDDAATSELEQSFQSLVSALGGANSSGSSATLKDFLQSLQTNMQSFSRSGNLVNTSA